MFFGTRTFMSKLGQTIAMLVFTSIIGQNPNNLMKLRMTTIAAAIFCIIGLLLLLLYNENKILDSINSEIYKETKTVDKNM